MTGVTMAGMLKEEAHVEVSCNRPTCDWRRRLTPTEAVAAFGGQATFGGLRGRLRCTHCGRLGADIRPAWCDADARSRLARLLRGDEATNLGSLSEALADWDRRRPKDAPSPIAEQARAALATVFQASAALAQSPAGQGAVAASAPRLPRSPR